MPTTGQNKPADQDDYIREWAKMMVNIWVEKIIQYKAISSGDLMGSVQLLPISANKIDVVKFLFKEYGVYVDRGTGKGIKIGNSGDLGFTPTRKAKPWFDKKFYYYTHKLAERLSEITGIQQTQIIKEVLEKNG
ncbi:MAG: hypothetical protein LBV74_01120 [Tannerella sp.]|jgi:hypothetical protein|nr:hypothetical protein [Tannerella sp.]